MGSMPSLYHLSYEWQQLIFSMMENETDELTPEQIEAMNKIASQLPEKLEKTQEARLNLESMAAACKVEAKRLTERAKELTSQADKLKAIMERHLLSMDGITKVDSVKFKFSLRTKTSRDYDITELPEKYLFARTKTYVPDMSEEQRKEFADQLEIDKTQVIADNKTALAKATNEGVEYIPIDGFSEKKTKGLVIARTKVEEDAIAEQWQ